jgi:hypothetical protein
LFHGTVDMVICSWLMWLVMYALRRVLLHTNTDVVEVFLVQHAQQSADAAAEEQRPQETTTAATPAGPGAAATAQQQDVAAITHNKQQLGKQEGHQQQQQGQQHLSPVKQDRADVDVKKHPTDVNGNNDGQQAARHGRPPALQQQHLSNTASAAGQASPITMLAKAISSGGLTAADVSNTLLGPAAAGAAVPGNMAGIKQEPGQQVQQAPAGQAPCPTPNFAGLNSPLFPQGLSSPGLGCAASPAAAGKWSEIDPEVWFEGDGSALGALGDFFKNDSSIFHQTAAAAASEQHDNDLITAW